MRRVLKKEIGIKDLFTATLIGHTFKFPDWLEGKSNFKFDMDRNVLVELAVSQCVLYHTAERMRISEPDRRDGMVRTSERTGANDDEFDVSFIIPIRPVLAAIATKF